MALSICQMSSVLEPVKVRDNPKNWVDAAFFAVFLVHPDAEIHDPFM